MKFSAVQLADWSQTKPSYFLHIFGVEIQLSLRKFDDFYIAVNWKESTFQIQC